MPRTDTPLHEKLSSWYGAAAVGALAFGATDAEAQIVFTDVDPDVVVSAAPGSPDAEFLVDFDGDGDAELALVEIAQNTAGAALNYLLAGAPTTDGPDAVTAIVSATAAGYQYFLPVAAGNSISAGNVATTGAFQFGPTFTYNNGDPNGWVAAGDTYIGVQFVTDGGTTHYGWVNVEVAPGAMTVKGFAYQSMADTPITAGDVGVAVEPGALPDGYEFTPIGPNPIRSTAHFTLRVAETESVRVSVIDMLGREVVRVFEGELPGGIARRMALQTGDLPAGTYVVRVTGDTFDTVQRVTVTH